MLWFLKEQENRAGEQKTPPIFNKGMDDPPTLNCCMIHDAVRTLPHDLQSASAA